MNLQKLAYLISAILHPLLLPTLAFFTLFYISPITALNINEEAKWRLLLVIFIMTFLAPLTSMLIFYTTGSIKSLHMDSTEDRRLPFIVTTLYYIALTCFFAFFEAFRVIPILKVILGGITANVFWVTIITFYWKISAHSTGISGIIGFLLGISYKYADEKLMYPLLATILLAGLLMSARLYLNAHHPLQILAGAALGFFVCLFAVVIFL